MTTVVDQRRAENELILDSKVEEIARVEDFIDQLNEVLKFKDDVYGNILVAVTEAVNNGIRHGNKEEVSKKVRVRSYLENDFLLIIEVTDEGPGFDEDTLPDPTDPDNLLRESGRGVFVMRHLADELVFLNNGSTAQMKFNI